MDKQITEQDICFKCQNCFYRTPLPSRCNMEWTGIEIDNPIVKCWDFKDKSARKHYLITLDLEAEEDIDPENLNWERLLDLYTEEILKVDVKCLT